jgi:hypothetical protein
VALVEQPGQDDRRKAAVWKPVLMKPKCFEFLNHDLPLTAS